MKKLPFILFTLIILILTSLLFLEFSEMKNKDKIIVELNESLRVKDELVSELETKNEILEMPEPKKHPIEIAVQKCMKERDYTTCGMSECVDDSISDWDKEINKSMKTLKKILPNDSYELLVDSQQKWEAYRKAQTTLINNTIARKQGTIYINITSGYNAGIVEQRARDIDAMVSDLTDYQ